MSISIIPFLVTLFLLRRLSRTFLIATRSPKWKKIFQWSMLVACALFISEIFLRIDQVTIWVWHFVILLIIGLVFAKKELRSGRITIMAVLPYEIISLASDLIEHLSRKTFKSIEEYSVIAIFFSIIWAIAMWIYAGNQQRKQEKERIKREHEEILHRVTEEQKAALEITVIERTAELTKQKEELQSALHELQETQAQLIQSEKMASLGELTAGIAHEIQNPLNFVNNFSEVSVELAAELKDELGKIEIPSDKKTNLEDILNDIVQNQEKINFHGKRADAIVKGMLQHSRSGSGQKEPADINELVDEYLRLSYHGLRAKDNTFNAVMKTDYDESIGKINIIPQEIGRVVLNLFTNAFYAINEKKTLQQACLPDRQAHGLSLNEKVYEPIVTVTTRRLGSPSSGGTGIIEIRVKDNGNGIPQPVLDKIFQPFFTTKPTGQGTGLGLSLSYDIIKAHNGVLKVETTEGEGSEFIIQLPV